MIDPVMSAELAAELQASDRRLTDPRGVDVRFSHLKAISKSPAHYRHSVQREREETLSMRLGSGAHALTFGTPEVVVFHGTRRHGTAAKPSPWDTFEAENAGKVILSEREFEIANGMATALRSSMVADEYLFSPGVQYEHDVRWEYLGRRCKGRIDALGPVNVIDLKTTKDASPEWLPYQIRREHWHVQATWYADGCERAGLGWRHPFLVAVENTPPHPVTVWRLDDVTIESARRTYHQWFERLLECEATNTWPSYESDVLTLSIGVGERSWPRVEDCP